MPSKQLKVYISLCWGFFLFVVACFSCVRHMLLSFLFFQLGLSTCVFLNASLSFLLSLCNVQLFFLNLCIVIGALIYNIILSNVVKRFLCYFFLEWHTYILLMTIRWYLLLLLLLFWNYNLEDLIGI